MSELTTCQNGITSGSLDKEVFDAVMLVKRLGRDVREGKRRQFSYIGRLLRDVEPELIDGLIKATKDGDMQKFQEFLGSDKSDLAEVSEVEEESEDEDEGYGHSHDIATKWFNGLVNKDADITSEIYSLSTVDFDRQELRKLVRNFCSLQDRNATLVESEGETKVDKKLLRAEKHLTDTRLFYTWLLPAKTASHQSKSCESMLKELAYNIMTDDKGFTKSLTTKANLILISCRESVYGRKAQVKFVPEPWRPVESTKRA
ncbi:hypothetical protein Tco_0535502 [Tanacetum coccineum]